MTSKFDPEPLRQLVSQYLLSTEPDRSEAFDHLVKMGLSFCRGLHLCPDTKIVGDEVRWQQSAEYDAVSMALLKELSDWHGKDEGAINAAVDSGTFDYLLRRVKQSMLDAMRKREHLLIDAPMLDRDVLATSDCKRNGRACINMNPASASAEAKEFLANVDSDCTQALEIARFLEHAAWYANLIKFGTDKDNQDASMILEELAEKFERKHKREVAKRDRKLATTRSVRKKLAEARPVKSFTTSELEALIVRQAVIHDMPFVF